MEPSCTLSKSEGLLLLNPGEYIRLIGNLLYLIHTRFGINFAIHKLNQFVSNPQEPHMTTIFHVLRCLKGCSGIDLLFSSNDH